MITGNQRLSYSPDDENPLKRELEQELAQSEWLQKFRRMGQVLTRLKAEVPVTQLCELQWVTEDEALVVRCPNEEVWESLKGQEGAIVALDLDVERIILQYQQEQVFVVKKPGS